MKITWDHEDPLEPRPRPCASCPYRKDVPSGVWAQHEYESLRDYDGNGSQQVLTEFGLIAFMCHQADGHLCSGWLGHRTPHDLLAVRLGVAQGQIAKSALSYTTDVPLFCTGAEAAEHGMRDYLDPSAEAREVIRKVTTVRSMRGGASGRGCPRERRGG